MYTVLITLLALAAIAQGTTHHVLVGQGGLTFSPETITADAGDDVMFHFYAEHSVASSTFDKPCVSGPNDIFSGVLTGNNEGDQVWTFSIGSTDPIWLYCSVGKHCQAGMVAVINPSNGTIDDYKSAAAKAATVSAPSDPTGGSLSTVTAITATATSTFTSGFGNSTATGSSNVTSTSTATSVVKTSHTTTITSTGSPSSATASSTKTSAASQDKVPIVLALSIIAGGLAALIV